MADTVETVTVVPVDIAPTDNNKSTVIRRIPNVGNGNLISIGDLTREEQKRITSAGGKKSGVVRKRKRLLRDAIQQILSTSMAKGGDYEEIRNKLIEYGVEDPTYADAMMAVQYWKTLEKADTEAAKFVRDSAGERPADVKDVRLQGTTTVELTGWSTEELQQRLMNLSDD